MSREGFHCKNPNKILSEEEILLIHAESLDILAEFGVSKTKLLSGVLDG